MIIQKYTHAFTLALLCSGLMAQAVNAQVCKTNEEAAVQPGKYLTAAQYPWPAARAEYFDKMKTPADKATARQTLEQLEKIEQQSHQGFTLTGGNWENYFTTEGYAYFSNTRLGQYTFQSSLHEYFCAKGKLVRNEEAGTILRIYVNKIPLNTLDRFIRNPFTGGMSEYDYGLQYLDWKNHASTDVQAQLIALYTYMTCNNQSLTEAINTGNNYFQDVPEKEIRPNNRNNYVYRYWFVKSKSLPVLLPVSRKEYLQSLLEYYEREKLYFPKLVAQLTKDHDAGVKQYSTWETDVADKIATVKKAVSDHNEEWLSAAAIVNPQEDAGQTYKAQLKERTNHNRFWKFYDSENKSEALYRYNPAYCKPDAHGAAKPQLITIAFRYVSIPSSLRILNNFTKNFDMNAVQQLLK